MRKPLGCQRVTCWRWGTLHNATQVHDCYAIDVTWNSPLRVTWSPGLLSHAQPPSLLVRHASPVEFHELDVRPLHFLWLETGGHVYQFSSRLGELGEPFLFLLAYRFGGGTEVQQFAWILPPNVATFTLFRASMNAS